MWVSVIDLLYRPITWFISIKSGYQSNIVGLSVIIKVHRINVKKGCHTRTFKSTSFRGLHSFNSFNFREISDIYHAEMARRLTTSGAHSGVVL